MPFYDVTYYELFINLGLKIPVCYHPLFLCGKVFQCLPFAMHRIFSLAASLNDVIDVIDIPRNGPIRTIGFDSQMCVPGWAGSSVMRSWSKFPQCKGQKEVDSLFACLPHIIFLSDICAHPQNSQGSQKTDKYVVPIFVVLLTSCCYYLPLRQTSSEQISMLLL